MSDKYLFMITSQGTVGYYSSEYIDQAVKYIKNRVESNISANIAIGFDGDGVEIKEGTDPRSRRRVLAEKVPTPSSTALLIVLRLINLGYTNVMLAQCQVAGYCGLADDYNRIYCTPELDQPSNNPEGTPFQGGKEIISELYKNLYGEYESKRIKLVDVRNPDDQLFSVTHPGEIGHTGQDEFRNVQFVTIGYNGSNEAHYENVTVDYGMGGQEDRDKLLLSPFPKNTFTTNTKVIGRNNKPVGLYGGTSHVTSDLSSDGEPAGSTAGWLESEFLQKFDNKYLIVFWDKSRVGKEDNTFVMSISNRIIDVGLRQGNIGNGEKGFGLDNNNIITIGDDDSSKFNSYKASVTRTGTPRRGGSRRKSKKSGIRTNGARKSRNFRR